MKKDDLLEIIGKLPANRPEQLAAEIYQGLDAVDGDPNTGVNMNAATPLTVITGS